MHALVLLWFLLLSTMMVSCQDTRCGDVLEPSEPNNGSPTDLEIEERMKELRKEMVRLQINSTLNLTEAPHSTQPLTREMIRLLLEEEEEQSRRQRFRLDESGEKLVIHAKGDGQPCLQYNGSFCKMFIYQLDATLNMSTVDIWIYKLATEPRSVSVSLTLSSSSEEKYHENMYYELDQVGWNKLKLQRFQIPSSWNDSVLYSAEIIGQNVEDTGNRRPFLIVSKLPLVPVRQRRDANCNTNESCCLKPLRFSFEEIGISWVLYPYELEANMCAGKCIVDHSAMRTHYERAMAKVLETDSSLHASLGECWTLCCKPKELEPVRLIYKDTRGVIHIQFIPELIVKSCSCS